MVCSQPAASTWFTSSIIKTLNFNERAKSTIEIWLVSFSVPPRWWMWKVLNVPHLGLRSSRFTMPSYFQISFVCCAGHMYDNSTLMETDLSLMRVFWSRLRFCGIVFTLVRTHPWCREKIRRQQFHFQNANFNHFRFLILFGNTLRHEVSARARKATTQCARQSRCWIHTKGDDWIFCSRHH